MDNIFDLKTANVGSSFYLNGTQIAQDVNVEIGEITFMSTTVFASGEQDVPVRGLFTSTGFTVNWKHITDMVIDAMEPDVNDYEFRFNEDILDDNTHKHRVRNVRLVLQGEPKSVMPAETINVGERDDIPTEFALYRYYRYHDGKPVIEFDRRKGVYRVNGKDKYQDIRKGL